MRIPPLKGTPPNGVPLKGTDVDYCLECSEKHLQSFRIFIKEGIQRAEKSKTTNDPAVQEKIRDAIAELTGCEDDTTTTLNEPKVTQLNTTCRDLRRFMWDKKLAFGQGTIDDLKTLYKQATEIVDKLYETEIAPTYEQELQQIIKEEQLLTRTPLEGAQMDKAIEEAIQAQKTEKKKEKKPKLNIEKLAELTPQEEEEALYKNMVNKYAKVYTPSPEGETP